MRAALLGILLILALPAMGGAGPLDGWSVGADNPRSPNHVYSYGSYIMDSQESGLLLRRSFGRNWDVSLTHSPSNSHGRGTTVEVPSETGDVVTTEYDQTLTWTRLRVARTVVRDGRMRCAAFVESSYAWSKWLNETTPAHRTAPPVNWSESWGWSVGLRPEWNLGKGFSVATRLGVQWIHSRHFAQETWRIMGGGVVAKHETESTAWGSYGGLGHELWSGLTLVYDF